MRELAVPQYEQRKTYTCGPACMVACLRFAGKKAEEAAVARSAKCTEKGTDPEFLAQAARRRGLAVDVVLYMTIDDLRAHVEAGHPVILAVQAWTPGPVPRPNYKYKRYDGHWVVAVAVRKSRIRLMDPSMPKKRSWVTLRDLMNRWHDYDERGVLRRLGIVVKVENPTWQKSEAAERMG